MFYNRRKTTTISRCEKIKYLLKQKIKRIFNGFNEVHVYPGSSGLIKLANNINIEYKKVQKRDGNYLITDYYIFDKTDYSWLLWFYKIQINSKRKRFWGQEPLIQLIKLLKYIFERNNKAKQVEKYYASQNAYDDKNRFLEIALEIASNINYSFFSYGYEEDPNNDYHHYIYYFEIKEIGQVSFHSENLFQGIPEFSGKWNGFRNEKFPFNLRDVKKLIKSEV